jgi:hypothetical protein
VELAANEAPSSSAFSNGEEAKASLSVLIRGGIEDLQKFEDIFL